MDSLITFMNKIKKTLYIIAGLIAFGLGAIGVMLPILPTTPFLLLASYCFVRGSSKFDAWFKGTSIYKKHLESFVEDRAMTKKQKVCILLLADFMLAFPFFIIDSIYMKIVIIVLVSCKYYYFTFKIETIR